MPAFHNRRRELAALESAWSQDRAIFYTLSGRRRVGKSRLLSHFLRERPHIYLVGTKQSAHTQLIDATREIYRVTGDELLAHQDFTSWDAVLTYLGGLARQARLGVVFDEFSYYCDETPSLPSLVQRWWDRHAEDGRVFLVLVDSHATFMDRLVQGDQPLYGRRTHDLRVELLDYADAASFFPAYSPEDRIRAYGVFGGMPAYLAACDPTRSLAENIRRTVLDGGAALRHEPDFLLAQERSIKDPVGYRSVLRAIAEQHTQPNEIAQAAGYRSPSDITGILQRLQEFDLVRRIVPITAAPEGRISRYVLTDHFLAFWFRYVQPAESLLERGLGDLVLDDLTRAGGNEIDTFISRPLGPWEEACASYLWRAQAAHLLAGIRVDALGCWWEGRGARESREIDLVGLRGKQVSVVGSCKWRRSYTKIGDLNDLREAARQIGANEQTRYALFSRSGFDPHLVEIARAENILLVTPADMFHPAIAAP